jgi:sugar lactone lactonase YvrE
MKPIFTVLILLCSFISAASGQITLNPLPTRVLGQDSVQITNVNPNLVEGREFFTPEGIALDTSTNPPALYVSDFANNRVLGFRSATGFANGQAADLVLGQPDLVTTFPQGPGGTRTTGLSAPSGIAVDTQGNVYVLDAGNNRILRFPKPFAQSGDILPDIALGQTSFSTNGANQGGISASTFFLSSASAVLQAFIAFDASGNLWVSDAGNNRVLRFNATVLGGQAPSGPAADIVLGQTDFVTGTYAPLTTNPLTSLTAFATPSGIAFDSAGRLFVAESLSTRRGRILMWAPPFSVGQSASRLLAVDTATPQPPLTSEFQLNASPGGLFAIGNAIGAVDSANSRILIFPPVEQWTPNATFQAAVQVVGQPDFSGAISNRGQPTAGPDRFSGPGAALFYGAELYVADSFNNRVIVMPQSGSGFGPATRVLGQDLMTLNAPNLVEGREFNFGTSGTGSDAGLAVDLSSNPPHVYVADTHNNRILGYNDLRNLKAGAKADLVIGQPDFQQVLVNYPANDAGKPNAAGLFLPTGLVVDSSGNLYVADRGNGRVLRFPKPFANYTPGAVEPADLVIGQSSFTSTRITDATNRTMSQPYGLAFSFAGGLLVSDAALNRVLYFQGQSADLRSGMSASLVFGQPDFNSKVAGSALNQMNGPLHISTDTDDRLYVADSGNSRVEIFDHAPTATPGQPAAQILTAGLSSPRAVYVSAVTGDIWVGDAGAGAAIRYPAFSALVAAGNASNATIADNGVPLAVVEDAWGDLFVADAIHRVAVYYPGLAPINAANFLLPRVLAPGMIAALFTQGNFNQFGGQLSSAAALPLPVQLNGIQVLFNGLPVPLFYADPNQINFQVPMGAPASGTADLQVMEVATGRYRRSRSPQPGQHPEQPDERRRAGHCHHSFRYGSGIHPGSATRRQHFKHAIIDAAGPHSHHGNRPGAGCKHQVCRSRPHARRCLAGERADSRYGDHNAHEPHTGDRDSEQRCERRWRRRPPGPDLREAEVMWRGRSRPPAAPGLLPALVSRREPYAV